MSSGKDFVVSHAPILYQSLPSLRGRDRDLLLDVAIEMHSSIYGYSGGHIPFFKLTMPSPKLIPTLRNIIERDEITTYESNIPYVLRFMIDRSISGCNWIECPAGEYQMARQKESTCQIEVDICFTKLVSHPSNEGVYASIAPVRIFSFDIECAGRKGVFPEPQHDPIIQIANIVKQQGEKQPFVRNVFSYGKCSPIAATHVLNFETEREMLLAWRKFVLVTDPDMMTGFNIENFDFYFLIERAKVLGLNEFKMFGRILNTPVSIKESTFSSKAFGKRESHESYVPGRVSFDVFQIIQRDYKLRSYSLNAVSAEFLGCQKEDVHHSIISDLWRGSDDDRRRLAIYCVKDAHLPLQLLDKLMSTINYMEMARVTGVPLSYLLSRGQQIKVISQLYREARKEALLIPNMKVDTGGNDGVGYEGATVIEPRKGYYTAPITTLDFTSLYPSIMMAHNLCYSTLLPNPPPTNLDAETYTRTPCGDYFVKAATKKGILPKILEDLLAARSKAKKDMAKETDPFRKQVLNGRQLALKISANSVYGFTGATVGKLPCLQISSSVTAFGRVMIETTKNLVEEKYTVANGYETNAEIIYGDTDSVMVKFGSSDMAKAMEFGREAAKYVTEHFVKPINLEFEKVYCPYLLISKKRYAGLLYTKPEKYDYIDAKGIETVRRDNCTLVKNVINTCLNKILIDQDVEGAMSFVKATLSDLLKNKMDLSLLVISKQLSRSAEDYASGNIAHVKLAEKMKKRDAASAPAVGDRVAYVVVQGAKNAKTYEKVEDPLYVLENDIPLDAQYYVENQLSKPLHRIFAPILKDPKVLLEGDHMRSIRKSTPKTAGIAAFTVKSRTCLGCRVVLPRTTTGPLCEFCGPNASRIYQTELYEVRNLEKQFGSLWTQCQSCQGSIHQTVLCTNSDCPIFYRRKKCQVDLERHQKKIQDLTIEW